MGRVGSTGIKRDLYDVCCALNGVIRRNIKYQRLVNSSPRDLSVSACCCQSPIDTMAEKKTVDSLSQVQDAVDQVSCTRHFPSQTTSTMPFSKRTGQVQNEQSLTVSSLACASIPRVSLLPRASSQSREAGPDRHHPGAAEDREPAADTNRFVPCPRLLCSDLELWWC